MKKLLLLFLCFAFINQISAQNRSVKGTVTDENGQPIANASIGVKGTTLGAFSSEKGEFSLEIPTTAKVIVVSFLGYTTREIQLTGESSYQVQLQPSSQNLEGVVVTAYGTTNRKAFTGTATTITNEKFKDLQISTITGALQGNASGVLSVTSTGQPGENPTIRIRGIGSFNASNEPLILVDGAPYSGSINNINPADVESITVLKDASATAIYGSRAANGILQIVTKKGKGKTRFSFSGISGYSKRAVKEYEKISPAQMYELTWETLKNDAIADPSLLTQNSVASPEEYATKVVAPRLRYNPFDVAQPVGMDGKLVDNAKLLYHDDWIDELTRTGVRNDYNFNISGSDPANTISYFLSGGYLHDQGIIIESDFKRYTGRARVDIKPTTWLKSGVNINLAYSNQNYPYQGSGGGSDVLSFARRIGPIYPVYLRDRTTGDYLLDGNGNKIFDFGNNSAELGILRPAAETRLYVPGQNPAATTTLNPITNERLTANGILYGEVQLLKELSFLSQYAINYNQIDANLFWNPFYGDGTTSGGYSYRGITNLYAQNFTNTFTFKKSFGNIHYLNIVAGMEAVKNRSEITTASTTGFTSTYSTQPSYGTVQSSSGTLDQSRMLGFFGRLNYDVAEKYHLSLSLRRDGTTRFADSSRWGTFYAVGGAWNLDKEAFMKSAEFLSDLKLKASYGTQGNQFLPGSFPYLGVYQSGWNIGSASGVIVNSVNNGYLTWEKQQQLDLGVEFGFWEDRLTGSVVYFRRTSDALLFDRPLAPSSGINDVSDNVGGVENNGIEVELNSLNIKKKNFEWRTSFNITKLKNKITQPAPGTTQEKGGSWYYWYLPEYAGVDASDGLPTWYMDDPDNEGKKITTKDYNLATRYHVGSRLPDYTGGITNTFRYKDFDLTILASFALGGKMYDGDYAGLMGAFNSGTALGSNASIDILNRWQSVDNPGDGQTPKLTTAAINATASSTRFLYNLDYMRIRNITLGYRLPQHLLRQFHLENARFFVDLQNPFTFFGGPKGTDPEAGGLNAQSGSNNTTTNKTLAIGINIGL
ncbi:hypothetical protein COR50_13635 [Chitinophaga caeni]|uniref:SusC/RagA family TonB-linked outer membrane protein n=1 Tax=Chitinophaga caeni TaxID=2029983 RepID=A0A291QVR0_9BACT|nr:SusC/RagA family TonB-linked outer membrane protein [Chitinophaga caeni]ATL48119.1 hypothetical protein COR50_13635 [Chitinophaga caeni]